MNVCVQNSSSYKDTSHTGLGPTLWPHFSLITSQRASSPNIGTFCGPGVWTPTCEFEGRGHMSTHNSLKIQIRKKEIEKAHIISWFSAFQWLLAMSSVNSSLLTSAGLATCSALIFLPPHPLATSPPSHWLCCTAWPCPSQGLYVCHSHVCAWPMPSDHGFSSKTDHRGLQWSLPDIVLCSGPLEQSFSVSALLTSRVVNSLLSITYYCFLSSSWWFPKYVFVY